MAMSGARARDVDRFEAGLLGERGAQDPFRDDAELDEDLPEALAPGGLRPERVAELLTREIAALDEERAERSDDLFSGNGRKVERRGRAVARILGIRRTRDHL